MSRKLGDRVFIEVEYIEPSMSYEDEHLVSLAAGRDGDEVIAVLPSEKLRSFSDEPTEEMIGAFVGAGVLGKSSVDIVAGLRAALKVMP